MPEEAHSDFMPDWFSLPADSLLQIIERRHFSVDDVADAIGGGRETLIGLVSGAIAIDPPMAKALSSAVGGTERFWLQRQENFERALDRVLASAWTEVDDWLGTVQAPGRRQPGRASEQQKRDELRKRLVYYRVNSLAAWHTKYGRLCEATQFRKSQSFESNRGATSLWLRHGELQASLKNAASWNSGQLESILPEVVALSRVRQPDRFLPKLVNLCATAGVAVVALRAPDGCRASGASRMISSNKAMILLSFRHLTDDHFWFTVFHEIGHLILHGAQTFIDGDGTSEDMHELEANEFARKCIVPEDRRSDFEQLRPRKEEIIRFAVSLSVSPGLIVGQLQHRGRISRNNMNYLKRRWTWEEVDAAIAEV